MVVEQEDWLEVSQADLDIMLEDYRRAEVGFENENSESWIACRARPAFFQILGRSVYMLLGTCVVSSTEDSLKYGSAT